MKRRPDFMRPLGATPLPADPYSFRPPRGSHAMRAGVAYAIGAASFAGVEQIVPDVRHADVVYIVCDRSAWTKLLAAATRYSGCERKGDRRLALFDRTGGTRPVVHYLVFCDRPSDPFRYTLEAWEVGTVRGRVIVSADDPGDLVAFLPDGYAPTGVPGGKYMTEVWVRVPLARGASE